MQHSKRVAELFGEKRQLLRRLKVVNDELDKELALAGEELIQLEIPRLPIAGALIHFRRRAYVKVRAAPGGPPLAKGEHLSEEMYEAVKAAFAERGIEQMAHPTVNLRSLNAWVSEQLDEEDELLAAGKNDVDLLGPEIRALIEVDSRREPAVKTDSAKGSKAPTREELDEDLDGDVVE